MELKLKLLPEFKKALENYRVSDKGLRTLQQTDLVLFLAPSGGGRNTIIQELVKTGKYYFIVSDTTRPPRLNNGVLEQDGVNYWFRSEEQMLDEIKAGELLEAEIIHSQQVSGISIRELGKAKEQGKIAVTDIDIGGVQNILNIKPDARVMLILPPSFEQWMKRLNARGRMEKSELYRRMHTAINIFSSILNENYCIVINDSVSNAVNEVDKYVNNISIPDIHDKGTSLAKKLIDETKAQLHG